MCWRHTHHLSHECKWSSAIVSLSINQSINRSLFPAQGPYDTHIQQTERQTHTDRNIKNTVTDGIKTVQHYYNKLSLMSTLTTQLSHVKIFKYYMVLREKLHRPHSLSPLDRRAQVSNVTLCHRRLKYIFNFWHSGTLALRAERQSARMSEIKNGRLYLECTDHFYKCNHLTQLQFKGLNCFKKPKF